MGGNGSGGLRVGSGPKPRLATSEAAPRALPEPIACPQGLRKGADRVWAGLAPLATAQGTLVAATVPAFVALCELVVLQEALISQVETDGYTVSTAQGLKAHPLLARYQTGSQQMKDLLTRFRLAPIGKEVPVPQSRPQTALERLQADAKRLHAVK